MDEDNFEEATLKISDLITEYQERGNAQVDLDDLDGGHMDPDEDEEDYDEDAALERALANARDNRADAEDVDAEDDNNNDEDAEDYGDGGFEPPGDDDDDDLGFLDSD
eukprot:TRINITY_DN1088_c0_g1_i1.p2 TRINITY_DN1088_c0_g1~~TRINITY_DN1088_c0_g1_i1.p2  ORF type:complete len:108 (+),score=28.29 TRINITY_DN1088_c0_g1_i1:285-608(+)